jgi:hypothetical protein
MIMGVVGVLHGFILGFYVCYSGFVIGGENASFRVIGRGINKIAQWFRSRP